MKDIDWGEAPEGATHAYQHGDENITWYKDVKENTYSFRHNSAEAWSTVYDNGNQTTPIWYPLIQRPQSTQWQGPQDGLPPVGARCQVVSSFGIFCNDATITYQGLGVGCFINNETGKECSVSHYEYEFRPIPSERDKATYELARDLGDICPMPDVVNKVIDLGYRRPIDRAEAYDRAIKSVGVTDANEKAVSLILDALGYKD